MAEAKSRREAAPRTRTRVKPDLPLPDSEDRLDEEQTATLTEPAVVDHDADEPAAPDELPAEPGRSPAGTPPAAGGGLRAEPARVRAPAADDYRGFDEEINNRYEEIKRGSTHIGELQQMTMPQLLKIAKEEGLSDYTGL